MLKFSIIILHKKELNLDELDKNVITFLLIFYKKYLRVNIYLHKNKLYFILSLTQEVILVKLFLFAFQSLGSAFYCISDNKLQ